MPLPIARKLPVAGIVAIVSISLVGCSGGEAPATFTSGSNPDNPLDGGVISDDGNMFVLDLEGGSELKGVDITGIDGQRRIGFEGVENGVAVPRELSIEGGSSTLGVDREAGTLTVQTEVAFVGATEFSGDIGFDPFGREALQNGATSCEEVVDAIDRYCSAYLSGAASTREQVVDLTVQTVRNVIGSNIADGVITDLITRFYDVLDDFCGAWQELREGVPGQTSPVDPCG